MDQGSQLLAMALWDWFDLHVFFHSSRADFYQSAFYGAPKPDEERFAVFDKLYAEGELFWDSADVYMDNEDLIG